MEKAILLVDDEPQLLFSVGEFLSRVGYDVTPAESGTEALAKLLDSPPDLIISDIRMENMDGFEFRRRVAALTGDGIPFIFLTAKSELQDRLEGLRGGADDYVTKPFEPEELEARVSAVLNRVSQTRLEDHRDLEGLRGRILAGMASRLRAPATSLMAHLNLLLSERFGQNEAEQERYLWGALRDANVLTELVSDLSWAGSDVTGELSLKREPIRVAPVVRGAAARAARLAAERSVSLHISCGGLLSGNIDGSAMTRALSGLLHSAVQLSRSGSEVSISATRAPEGGLEFVITDGGYHSRSDELPTSDMADALGFARRVVEGHGGRSAISRKEDGRQSFVIWVPGRVAKHVGRRK